MGFRHPFFGTPNLWFGVLKKIFFFMNIENFSLKGIIQNYVGCFLVYLFMDLYFLKKRKRLYRMRGLNFVWDLHQTYLIHISNLNFNVQLFWKSKNHLFWCFLSQLQYRNENQNFFSNFIFQFIKKTKWHFGWPFVFFKKLKLEI